jgi:hypothetical protein
MRQARESAGVSFFPQHPVGIRALPRLPLLLAAILTLACVLIGSPAPALAQSARSDDSQIVEKIEVVLLNPSPDATVNQRVSDLIRRSLNLFPGMTFNRTEVQLALSRSTRQAAIADAQLEVTPGSAGGVIVTIRAQLGDKVSREDRGYLLTGETGDLPVLFDRDGTIIVGKLEALTMLYGNVDAWYGRPDLFLAGNPLVSGETAGKGASGWAEGFVHTGLYGLTPLGEDVYAYGGLSTILRPRRHQLFTDESRYHLAIEDAYLGLVGGETFETGDRLVWNVSAGRKRYAIGDSMIIGNTASNGDERAALQSNPRWAADMLVLGQLRYHTSLAELFYLDPDELPEVDSRTRMAGINLETDIGAGFSLGGSFIKVLESDYAYYALTAPDPASATLGREGPGLRRAAAVETADGRFSPARNRRAARRFRHVRNGAGGRGRIPVPGTALDAGDQLPLRAIFRRRPRDRALRAVGSPAFGRQRGTVGAGHQPFQAVSGQQPRDASDPDASAAKP